MLVRIRLRMLVVGMLFVGVLPVAAAPAATAVPPVSAQPAAGQAGLLEATRTALQAVVTRLEAQPGGLAQWQKALIEQEVLLEPQNFVRESRQAGDQFKVTIDELLLRRVLLFYGPTHLGNEQPRLAARIEAQEGCEICTAAAPALKKLFQQQLDRRMARPVWFRDQELPSSAPSSAEEPEMPRLGLLRALETSRGLQGAFLLRIESIPTRDEETGRIVQPAHPEDAKLLLRLGIVLGGSARQKIFKKLEFQATDSIEHLARKLWIEAMSDLGSRLEVGPGGVQAGTSLAGSQGTPPGRPEVLLRVAGVQDYFQLTALKSQLQLAVGELDPVIERVLARGKVTFAIRSSKSVDEVRASLGAVLIGNKRLVIRGVNPAGGGEIGKEIFGEIQ